MRRNTCSACGHDNLEMFLDLGMSPIADAYTREPFEGEQYPLQLAVCTRCWLVQLLEIVDPAVLFGNDYSFYSSASAPLSAYHERYALDVLEQTIPEFVVEVGCNDGDFLRHFVEAGSRVLGVDPATGPVAVARGRHGMEVLNEPFGAKQAREIVDAHGPADLVIANHVLAHVESVADVLEGISILMQEDGRAYIEVQYLPDLLVNNAFDLVYHEHRNFFSISSLQRAVERWGMRVVYVNYTDRQGGSIRAEVRKSKRWPGVFTGEEAWLRNVDAYRGFQGRAERIRDRLADLLFEHGPVVGYGAPAKATTLIHFLGDGHQTIEKVLDTTPAKQGRYIPGTDIEIVAPETVDLDANQTVLLLAHNYSRYIMRQHRGFLGDWIVPIPAPVVL